MSKVAVVVDNLFEDSEYTEPVEALQEKGHTVVVVGLKGNTKVRGKKQGTIVNVQQSVSNVSASDFDALLIPGGFSPDILRAHDEVVAFVRDFSKSDKPVFAICHGPQLLITADVLKGRKVTGYKSIVQDLKNAGAEFSDAEVVIDRNLVTSRHPGDIPAFCKACVALLEKARV